MTSISRSRESIHPNDGFWNVHRTPQFLFVGELHLISPPATYPMIYPSSLVQNVPVLMNGRELFAAGCGEDLQGRQSPDPPRPLW
ncbi:MAG TPA: hypothetical protein DD856_04475 [Sulfobacillus sp.]|nr:hypothetical protein [Sulfobacillus sp.]